MTSASAGTRLAAAVPVRTLPSRLAGFGRAKIGVKRNVLNAEADAADQRAAWLEGYLLRGDGEMLARVVGELEPLPSEAIPTDRLDQSDAEWLVSSVNGRSRLRRP
jgi:hypothetical protein